MPFLKMFQSGNDCKPLPTMDAEQKARYEHFRRLLRHNRTALTAIADLEQLYYDNRPFTLQFVERKIGTLLTETEGLVKSLGKMATKDYRTLSGVLNSIRRSIQQELAGEESSSPDLFTLPLALIKKDQTRITGAKAANLALMHNELAIPTPNGFAVTTAAYWYFIKETGLIAEIDDLLAKMSADDPASQEATSRLIRQRIMAQPLPLLIGEAIDNSVRVLSTASPAGLLLAVRSSAVGEDGEISFAGQYASILNVEPAGLAEAYKEVIASKYSAPALSYRLHHGLDDLDTPMAVLIITMIAPRQSGVLYTVDPLTGDPSTIRVSAVAGLGDELVGGGISPQHNYRLSKTTFALVPPVPGETPLPPTDSDRAYLQDLWHHALRLEEYFNRPLDIEWVVDESNHLFLLQVRPLLVAENKAEESPQVADYPEYPLLLDQGRCAASGIAVGQVLLWQSGNSEEIAGQIGPDTILVTRTASTMLTPWVGKVRGIITDIGSTASHLASVAREFGVPALFDTQIATTTLKNGDTVTLWASNTRVYKGNVAELTAGMRPTKRPIFASPAQLRMQRLLDLISPLHLTDAASPDFRQDNCRTVHDIIRVCHEYSVREMFRFSETADRDRNVVQIKIALPLQLYALDLGGGLREGLTTCNDIGAHDIVSVPFRALWRGLSHPGINWTSAVAVGAHNFMSLMAGGSLLKEGELGRASYTVVSGDYMNLSIRFGFHFATIDVLCGDDAELNYAALQFTGGAGAYSGKSLRIQYIAKVLGRLGFVTALKGELIEASLTRLDRPAMEEVLDQLGRLLGSTRLLDMAISNAQQIETMAEAFFNERYDFLEPRNQTAAENFYLITGDWQKDQPGMEQGIIQDGSHFSSGLSTSINKTIGRFLGQRRYIEILDNIEAYHYFPLAIAKNSHLTKGLAQVMVKPLSGIIDQAGGLAFGIRDWANYFVFRINALENNAVLFEFHNSKRLQRAVVDAPIEPLAWYTLRVEINDKVVRSYLDELLIVEYEADRDLGGYVGLWTKADSVTLFKELTFQATH